MSTTPHLILDYLVSLFTDAATLNYVKQVLIGRRESITNVPVLIIEPVRTVEYAEFLGDVQSIKMEVDIIGIVQVYDKDKQIVGDAETKGIFDFENDVKNVLDSKYQYEDANSVKQAVDSVITETTYNFSQYPYRGFNIRLEIKIRQTRASR